MEFDLCFVSKSLIIDSRDSSCEESNRVGGECDREVDVLKEPVGRDNHEVEPNSHQPEMDVG